MIRTTAPLQARPMVGRVDKFAMVNTYIEIHLFIPCNKNTKPGTCTFHQLISFLSRIFSWPNHVCQKFLTMFQMCATRSCSLSGSFLFLSCIRRILSPSHCVHPLSERWAREHIIPDPILFWGGGILKELWRQFPF